MPKISVIIPVFNVENYLEKCLDSVVNQTLNDIEIICINDGSTDNSPNILESYVQKDARIIVINQENKGLSAARNRGLEIAKGEYISFVDSDDWIDENFLEKLYEAITKNNCDIAIATIIRKREYHQKYRVLYSDEKIFSTFEEKVKICAIPRCCYVWNKLYKARLVKDSVFKEGVYYEDMLWLPLILDKAEKLVTVPNTVYWYRVNNNSIVKKNPSPKKQLDLYNAKKFLTEYLTSKGVKLSEKDKEYTKEIKYFFGIPIIKIKECNGFLITLLFNLIPIFKKPV